MSPPPEPLWTDHNTSFLFGAEAFADKDPDPDFKLDWSCSFGSPGDVCFQEKWTCSDPWREEEGKLPGWSSRAGALGKVVTRVNDDWTQRRPPPNNYTQLDSTFSYSPVLQQQADLQHPLSFTHISGAQSPPSDDMWGNDCVIGGGGMTTASASYGSKCWTGQERKRSAEAGGFTGAGK